MAARSCWLHVTHTHHAWSGDQLMPCCAAHSASPEPGNAQWTRPAGAGCAGWHVRTSLAALTARQLSLPCRVRMSCRLSLTAHPFPPVTWLLCCQCCQCCQTTRGTKLNQCLTKWHRAVSVGVSLEWVAQASCALLPCATGHAGHQCLPAMAAYEGRSPVPAPTLLAAGLFGPGLNACGCCRCCCCCCCCGCPRGRPPCWGPPVRCCRPPCPCPSAALACLRNCEGGVNGPCHTPRLARCAASSCTTYVRVMALSRARHVVGAGAQRRAHSVSVTLAACCCWHPETPPHPRPHTPPARTHTRTHARTHARTHTRTHARTCRRSRARCRP
jgi:hypothetical protein